jgi:hypothetical protein
VHHERLVAAGKSTLLLMGIYAIITNVPFIRRTLGPVPLAGHDRSDAVIGSASIQSGTCARLCCHW